MVTFEEICEYAKCCIPPRSTEKSRAKDMTMTFWERAWDKAPLMVLYEGEKKRFRGKTKEEICWVCVDPYGKISSIAARTLRNFKQLKGFTLRKTGTQIVKDFLEINNKVKDLTNPENLFKYINDKEAE